MTELYRVYAPELELVRAGAGGDGRTVEGIFVPYEHPQFIPQENITEQIGRGAANHQFRAAHRIRFSNGHLVLGGSIIGRAHELRDDARGLWGMVRASKTQMGDDTIELIRDGALEEWSIGFREGKNRTLPDGTIERSKIDIFEIAIVPEGAYGQRAKVTAVRSAQVAGPAEDPARSADERVRAALAAIPVLSLGARVG